MKRRKSQRERILAYIGRRPVNGATRRELVANLGILHQSVGPRVVELIEADEILPSGLYRDGCEVLVRSW